MKSLSSPIADSGAVLSVARSRITAFVLKWGIGLGMLAGAITGASIGWLTRGAVQGDQFQMPLVGLMMGVLAGLILGLFVAFVTALLLVRSVPAVLSGKTQASGAATTAAGVAAIAVIGLVLVLLSLVWHGALGEAWVLAPSLALVVVSWIAGTVIGERALKSVLNLPSTFPSPSSPSR